MIITRKNRRLVALLLVIVALSSFCAFSASADGQSAILTNYDKLFSAALNSDGAASEASAYDLSVAFDADPTAFIEALSEYKQNDLHAIVRKLVYAKSYGNIDDFRAEICERSDNTALTAKHNVLAAITSAIDELSDNSLSQNAETPIVADAFDVETILGFIELNELTGNTDEQYFHTLASAYKTDPQLFADMLRSRSMQSISAIAKAIAYDCIKSGDRASSVSEAKKNNDSIIALVEAEIADEANGDLSIFLPLTNEKAAAQGGKSLYPPTALSRNARFRSLRLARTIRSSRCTREAALHRAACRLLFLIILFSVQKSSLSWNT